MKGTGLLKLNYLWLKGLIILLPALNSCSHSGGELVNISSDTVYADIPFVQEYHEAFSAGVKTGDNEIRSIAVDHGSNIWIATASGVFKKGAVTTEWEEIISGKERGPAYSVVVNSRGDVLIGAWNGLYRYRDNNLTREDGPVPPVSEICADIEGDYALGPFGIWRFVENNWEKQNYSIARSVRDVLSDNKGTLWVATDAGLYKCRKGETQLIQDVSELISCNVKAIAFNRDGKLWAGVLGGVSVRDSVNLIENMTPADGIPSANIRCIGRSPDGAMWVGTDVGVVRFAVDGSHSLRFSRRWLTDNRVTDIDFDSKGNAWIGTENGVSAIKRKTMTLAEKETDFYNQLMKRHMREPWTCGVLRLETPGDTATWQNSDDDNDGEYTGGYLAMESFRYAATGDPDARAKARKAFDFLKFLQEVTATEGFFARSVIPVTWKTMSDPNRKYDEKQLAEELVKDPRYKPVEERWRKSKDGRWLWKGDTSSDEMDGHMMSYFFYYELAADEEEKVLIRNHVRRIMDCLIRTGYNLIDIDGTHTRWSVWSPEQLNNDPDWASEKSLNSMELLAYLKFAAHITGDDKYEKEYKHLIKEEGYLENASHLNSKNPAWQIYFDRTMEGYLFPILIKYEEDPELKKFYRDLADEWMNSQEAGENLINNFTYAFATGNKVNTRQSVEFLRDTPLDLVDWPIDHTLREDVHIVRKPILEEIQVEELPSASERSTVRWDKNPWSAVQGNASQVREPVFWLWPYWMARYLNVIQPSGQK
ncbi:MAG: regulator [Bacteroidales bacterium]|nr:regulator [Bacteroidales bacterium]